MWVKMKRKFISLFTGAGGLDWGFHNSGSYELIVSNEILKPHLKTYTDNHNLSLKDIEDYDNETGVAVCGDIHELNVLNDCDIIMGGPPCQDFSILRGSDNRAGFTVKRGKLYEQYLRILKSSNPDIFVFENVAGMLSANKGAAYRTIQEDFKNAGYELIFNDILNIADVGAPQARKRLIIIGLKKELVSSEVYGIIDKYLHNDLLKKYPLTPLEVFEGKVLTDLNDKYADIIKKYEHSADGIDNEEALKWKSEYQSLSFDITCDYSKANNISDFNSSDFDKAMEKHREILEILGFFGNNIEDVSFSDDTNITPRTNRNVVERMHHIPPYYNFKAVENTKWQIRGLMSNIYKRLHPLKPSPTVIAYGGGGTGGYHYDYDRQVLTNRERARLQTFPDNYLFNGNASEIRAQIGEAVPPIASYWIEKAASEILDL